MGNPTCAKCPAACCKWEVEVSTMDEDQGVPEEMIDFDASMYPVMKRNPVTLYCVALDLKTFTCSIYDKRPAVCREFPMGGSGCVQARSMMSPFELRQTR